ncbi:MAG: ABC transporter ATP-binding protein [Gemmatimonadales bacterium]
MTAPFLQVEGLSKRFGDHQAVADLSFTLARGAMLALLGPSGSGKTTTLRMLAGFEQLDAGRILVEGRDVTPLGPAARRFGMVFQHYALFPHLSVFENVAFGLSKDADRASRVAEVLRLVDLAGFESRSIGQLSGGQQQRVALARALAPEPRLLFLDEPLSNLDPSLRERTRAELRAALKQIGITTILVTHEQEEAFALGDLVAVLKDGRLQQLGTPTELYEHPKNQFVATFVGRASALPGTITAPGRVRVGDVDWPTAGSATGAVTTVVRPEDVVFTDSGLPGTVVERRYLGGRALFRVSTAAGTLEIEAPMASAELEAKVHVTARRSLSFNRDSV